MSGSSPRRPHLVERAANASRAAMVEETARTARSPLAPVEVIRAAVETITAPPSRHAQAAGLPGHNEPAPVIRAQLRSAGLVDEAGLAREEIALVREQMLRNVEAMPPAEGRQARLMVITSARSDEGKSFAALNLAASIAEGAHRPVILVDSDRGPGSLTALLGLHDAPGLEQLRDSDDPDPVGLLRRTEIPGLFVLPHGTPEPYGTPGSVAAKALLRLADRLSDHLIVLDTPACLESSTAGLLAAAAGQIALVVGAESTTQAEVEAALDILDACPTLQLLLNRASLRVSGGFRGDGPRWSDEGAGAQA